MWAHSLSEYRLMFDLSDAELDKKLLDCAAGVGSFGAEMMAEGKRVVACDELYRLPLVELKPSVEAGINAMLESIKQMPGRFLWKKQPSLEKLREYREEVAKKFIADYQIGREDHRYRSEMLPVLSFQAHSFDIALCSHFLFVTQALDLNFHVAAIKKMCQVAEEARIFPLLDPMGEVSTMMGPVIAALQSEGYGTEIRQVDYALQKDGNAMLRVWAGECEI